MLYCATCGSPLALDVTNGIKVLATVGLGARRFAVSSLTLEVVAKTVSPQFYCPNCKQVVQKEDIVLSCAQCGVALKTATGYFIPGSGGVYCLKHAQILGSGKSPVSVDSATNTLIITQ
jgi:hypothetical protein